MSSDFLPEEITTDIMLRLPLKSIFACKEVCKSWNSLIKSSAFIESHLSRTIQTYRRDDVHILLVRERKEFYSLYRNNPCAPGSDQYVELSYPSEHVAEFRSFHDFSRFHGVVGTCNGLVCLAGGYDITRQEFPIIIWNPTVRKFVVLPRPSIIMDYETYRRYKRPGQTHAFGYDSRNNDYKVLRILSDVDDPHRVEIYSLTKGSWRRLAVALPSCFNPGEFSFNCFTNGASHWIQTCNRNGKQIEREDYVVIVFFDMTTESFGEMRMPEALRENKPRSRSSYYISKHEESLALIEIESQMDFYGLHSLQVWVMKEYGAVESWTRLYMISDLVSIPKPPFGFKSSCELVFKCGYFPNPLKVLNFETGQVKDFVIDEHHTSRRLYQPVSEWYVSTHNSYVQSLVLFDQTSAISY